MKKKNRLKNFLRFSTYFYSKNYHKIVLKNCSQQLFFINVFKNTLNFCLKF